ncbi:hypothetical protein F5Y09DRAFT_348458 [Xylaria sp. FL1042]|nr:hypothetical protein F5Y09DRAFT_348458 [Xylaria sp. FL1042]
MSSSNQLLPKGYKKVSRSSTPPNDQYLIMLRNKGHIAFKELIQSISLEERDISVAEQHYNVVMNATGLDPNNQTDKWTPKMLWEYNAYKRECKKMSAAKGQSAAAESAYDNSENASYETQLSLRREHVTKLREWFEVALSVAQLRLDFLTDYPESYGGDAEGHLEQVRGALNSTRNAYNKILKFEQKERDNIAQEQSTSSGK